MSADDPKRRQSPPKGFSLDDLDENGPAEGAYFRAPTLSFQALPTEVLDVDAGAAARAGGVQAGTRAARLPSSLSGPTPGAPGSFQAPPPTEALGQEEVRRLTRRHAPVSPGLSHDGLELTNPEPFRVNLDSEEMALLEVAREPTQHDLRLEDLQGPPSETSTDVERPRPISGLMDVGRAPTEDSFEDRTLALEALGTAPPAYAPSPLSEPTAEDEVLPSEPSERQPAFVAPPPSGPQDAYYRELREVVGAARVFVPERHAPVAADPGFREDSDEWPEITLPPAPAPRAPEAAGRRFPLGLVAFLACALVVSAGGIGIGVALSKRGVHLDDVLAAVGIGDGPPPPAAAEPAAPPKDDGKSPPPIDPSGAWKGRTVRVHLANVEDVSGSGAGGLADTLRKAFASALDNDEHAAWQVVRSSPRRGYGFDVSLAVLSVDEREGGALELRCALEAKRQHAPKGSLKVAVSASRKAEGSLAGASPQKVAQEAARACGFALALAFFAPALAEAP